MQNGKMNWLIAALLLLVGCGGGAGESDGPGSCMGSFEGDAASQVPAGTTTCGNLRVEYLDFTGVTTIDLQTTVPNETMVREDNRDSGFMVRIDLSGKVEPRTYTEGPQMRLEFWWNFSADPASPLGCNWLSDDMLTLNVTKVTPMEVAVGTNFVIHGTLDGTVTPFRCSSGDTTAEKPLGTVALHLSF